MKSKTTTILLDGNEFDVTIDYNVIFFSFDTPPQLSIVHAWIGDWDIKDSASFWSAELAQQLHDELLAYEQALHPVEDGDDLSIFRDDLIE